MKFIALALLVLQAVLLYLEARETTPGGRKAILKFENFLSSKFKEFRKTIGLKLRKF